MKRQRLLSLVLVVFVAMMFGSTTGFAQTKKPTGKTSTAKTAPAPKAAAPDGDANPEE